MTPLCELAVKWKTAKGPLPNNQYTHSYCPFYYEMLKDKPVKKVLEIGLGSAGLAAVGQVPGCSLFMWEEFFPNARIYGIDIRPDTLVNEGRIRSFVADQNDLDSMKKVLDLIGPGFDFVVDDASHVPAHQASSANLIMPMMAPGGIYVIEDVGYPGAVEKDLKYPSKTVLFRPDLGDDRLMIIRS